MDLSFWIYVILFITVVVLIFKFVKKIIYAVFSVIFLTIFVFAGVGGLVYLDYKSIVEQDVYNVNLIYGSSEDPNLGLSLIIDENGLDVSNVESLDVDKIDEDFLENIEDEDGIYVYVSEDVFENILDENETYYLPGTENVEIMNFEFDLGLNKEEVLEIVDSSDSKDTYIQIIIENNEIPQIPGINPEEFIGAYIDDTLNEITLDEVLFVSVVGDIDSKTTAELFEGFKEDELEVYPKKFSFNLVKLLPVNTIINIFSSDDNSSE